MAETEESRALRMHVQVAWEDAMDFFFERLDELYGSTEIQESDVVSAVHRQIGEEAADRYQKWIEG